MHNHKEYLAQYRERNREKLRADRRAYYARKRQEMKDAGLLPVPTVRKKRTDEEKAESRRRYYSQPHVQARRKEYMRAWHEKNPDAAKRQYERDKAKILVRSREWKRKLRQQVLDGYGNKCACCEEHLPEFLALDHVNNDGAEHRRSLKMAQYRVYLEAVRRNFPADFQLLCHNCNASKYYYGECPHERMRREAGSQ